MKTLKAFWLILVLFPALSVEALAEDMRSRPDYQKVFAVCRQDPDGFKSESYKLAFNGSLKENLGAANLDLNNLVTLTENGGLSSYDGALLRRPALNLAVQDCLGGPSAMRVFADKMALMDGTGRLVAGAVFVGEWWGINALLRKAFALIAAKTSGTVAIHAMTMTYLISSTYSLRQIEEQHRKEELQKTKTVNTNYVVQADACKTRQESDRHIATINQLLVSPELSSDQKTALRDRLSRWKKVQQDYSCAPGFAAPASGDPEAILQQAIH